MAVSYSISKAGLEVYTTTKVTETTSNSSNDETDVQNNFTLQNGETTKIDYIGELYSDSYEQDYADISSNSSVSVPIKYLNYFFKGKKIALKKSWQKQGSVLKWADMDTVVLGFITEITWNRDKIDLKISGMDKLLEKEAKFTFKKTKRSKIIKEIIKASGLKAKVDVVGLKDDVIDFTNVSSSDSNSKSNSSNESEEIQSFVNKIIGNETDELSKLKKIHSTLCNKITYTSYECSRYSTPEKCLKSLKLNCANAAMLAAACYRAANLKCYVIHGDYHFWVIVTANGKEYASDVSGHHELNQVWSTSAHPNSPFKGKNCGDNPDC